MKGLWLWETSRGLKICLMLGSGWQEVNFTLCKWILASLDVSESPNKGITTIKQSRFHFQIKPDRNKNELSRFWHTGEETGKKVLKALLQKKRKIELPRHLRIYKYQAHYILFGSLSEAITCEREGRGWQIFSLFYITCPSLGLSPSVCEKAIDLLREI